ncbi:hypothetical protein MGYG_08502 [Nannizzia gypsea CBS 118893]|uniref:FAD dependent oxidoreductase domain-containing protein n=1 Tax=Arthroderma gypseum (strain ATCC MYA-4604 / CBS 118893) TaxID=535722 RepID=E4V5W2_ARTGP|nr:hypothetical protein MGYG_08502 [Nannizzia gypsea CBS 118893]EFR05487.1 hypothetical protein MGYG_08502 [Nannizzia gypsea CBS 118893]
MSTVIIGGGIIGVSIAYFLSDPEIQRNHPGEIHIVDSSGELFSCASGYAAGFIARDWYAPELEQLGELSFGLHQQLAAEHDGAAKWGYMPSIALSLQVEDKVDDASMADEQDPSPTWLTRQKGGTVERISNKDSVAQVDPLHLCKFMLARCIERGVQVHNPARAISTTKDSSLGVISAVVIEDTRTHAKRSLPCTNIVFAAGPWTPRAFSSLFPLSRAHIPVLSLSGYSLVFRSPRHTLSQEQEVYGGKSHAVFTTHPQSCGFSPEVFSRTNAEIYLAGLNGLDIPLPEVATDAHSLMTKDKLARVREAARILMGRPQADQGGENVDDLEVVREALCFRPYIESGLPIVARLRDAITGDAGRVSGGLFMATGHGPWGISLSLGTGKVMAEMISGMKPSADVSGLGFEADVTRSKL